MQGLYVDIKCKQVMSALRDLNTHMGHQDIGRRTGIPLERRHFAIPVSSFVAWCTKVTLSFYTALSRKAAIMVAVLTAQIAANVVALYERI